MNQKSHHQNIKPWNRREVISPDVLSYWLKAAVQTTLTFPVKICTSWRSISTLHRLMTFPRSAAGSEFCGVYRDPVECERRTEIVWRRRKIHCTLFHFESDRIGSDCNKVAFDVLSQWGLSHHSWFHKHCRLNEAVKIVTFSKILHLCADFDCWT